MKSTTLTATRSAALSTRSLGPRRRVRPASALLAATVLGLLGAACSGSGGQSSSFVAGGQLVSKGNGLYFLSDDHFSGGASNLQISVLRSGRLVDVFDRRPDPQLPGQFIQTKRLENYLIGVDITTNNLEYVLESNAVTGQENLVILFPVGTPQFESALREAEQNLTPLLTRGLVGASATPPFTAVPRNSAVSIQFNDLLDAATIAGATIQIHTGSPPAVPYEARLLPDASHGAIVNGSFHTSRAILDFTVSTFESQQAGGTLPPNTLGLPGAVLINSPNAVVRIPTLKAIGQFNVLSNLSGHALGFVSNGPNDPTSPTLDVLRSFRSMGKTEITGDPNNGFLPDDILPAILGAQAISVTFLSKDPGTTNEFIADMSYETPACAMPARAGDVLQMPNNLAQVISPGQLNVGSAAVTGMRVRLLSGIEAQFVPGQGQFRSTWDPALGAPAACFVRFDPLPASAPDIDVSTQASVLVSFSEPVDPTTVQGLDTFTLSYDVAPSSNPMWANVIGKIAPSADLREFRFSPTVPLRHLQGNSETFTVDVIGDDPGTGTPAAPEIEGVTDLAGNPLQFDLTTLYGNSQNLVEFTILSTDPDRNSAGIGFKFASLDEDGNGAPELRGQYLIDTARQVLKPRSVTRFSVVVDQTQPLVGAMPQTIAGLVTPLSNWGSRTQTIWRYIDMGFTLLDDNNHNLDVEALWWSPFFPTVQQDNFPLFQLSVAHALCLPDEVTNAGLLPSFLFSGMVNDFGLNFLDSSPTGVDPPTVLAPKNNGYFVDPQLTQTSTTGITIFPWPVNMNVQPSQYKYWTWRDTGKTKLGGRQGGGSGFGADPQRLAQITGTGLVGFYGNGAIPTIGLPLLTEYRCYPDPNAFGLNGFKTSFALNSSYRPTFRSFSTGGVFGTTITTVDPDNSPIATGGINPTNGNNTLPSDNTVYWGQADFVVRVSRLHTIWLDTLTGNSFAEVVLEPDNPVQPAGTLVTLAFRGASNVTASAGTPWASSLNYDPYGDTLTANQLTLLSSTEQPSTVTFHPVAGNSDWHNNLSAIDGARFFQARVTFLSNVESDISPELSSLGFGFIH